MQPDLTDLGKPQTNKKFFFEALQKDVFKDYD